METLCRIRDIYRAIAEFEVKFMQEFDLSLNEGMLLCTLLNTPKLTSSEIAEGKSRITVIKNSTPEIPALLQEIV